MNKAITDRLDKLLRLEESKVPIGEISLERTVTNTLMEIILQRPWISFTLANDGDGNVQLMINKTRGGDKGTTIDSGETYDFDGVYPIVKKLFLVTEAAETTATVRIRALEGKSIDDQN